MNKKNKYILLFSILASSILLVLVVKISIFDKGIFNNDKIYKKYIADITVSTKTEKGSEIINITIKDDGKNAYIMSSNVDNPSYILGSDIYFLEDNVYYICAKNRTYRDFLKLISGIKGLDKVRQTGDYTYYSKVVNAQELNDILDSLFFSKKTTTSKVVEIIKKDDYITGFKLSLNDIDGYDNIDVIASFENIEEYFEVDTSLILGQQDSFDNIINYVYTKENIHEIIR